MISALRFTLEPTDDGCCPPILTVRRGQTNPYVSPCGDVKRLRDVQPGDTNCVEPWYLFNGVRIVRGGFAAKVIHVQKLGE